MFKAVWTSLPAAQRPALQKVLKHWEGFFPADVVRAAAQVTAPPPQQLPKPGLDPRLAPHPGVIPAVQALPQPTLPALAPPLQQLPYQQPAPAQPAYQAAPQYAAAQVQYPPAAPHTFPTQPIVLPAPVPQVPLPRPAPLPAPAPQVLPRPAVLAAPAQFAPVYAAAPPQAQALTPAYQQQLAGLPMPRQQLPAPAPYTGNVAPESLHQHQPSVPQPQVPAAATATPAPAQPQNAAAVLDTQLPAFLNELLQAGAISLPGAAGGVAVPPRSNTQRRGGRGKAHAKPHPSTLKPGPEWQASLPADDPRRSKVNVPVVWCHAVGVVCRCAGAGSIQSWLGSPAIHMSCNVFFLSQVLKYMVCSHC